VTSVEIGRELVKAKTLWVHQGRDPVRGLDCVGFICTVMGEPFEPRYGRDPHGNTLDRELEARYGAPVEDLREGDIVSLRWGVAARHVALIANHPEGGLSIIHCSNSVGRVTEQRLDQRWERRIVGIYRPYEAMTFVQRRVSAT
jgi:cell wall-associated NlpC family hydrolase